MKFILKESTKVFGAKSNKKKDSLKESLSNDLAIEFRDYCETQNLYIEEINGYNFGDNIVISYEIYTGDWKHDHLRSRFLAEEFFFEKGYEISSVNYYEIGESDSDVYDAHYDLTLEKIEIEHENPDEEIEINLLQDEEK